MRVLKLGKESRVKDRDKQPIQVEFTREEFTNLMCAAEQSTYLDERIGVAEKKAFLENLERICVWDERPFTGNAYLRRIEQWRVGVTRTEKYKMQKSLMKTNCKIGGADCPHNLRRLFWDSKTIQDEVNWDNLVKQHCPNCEHNINMLALVG